MAALVQRSEACHYQFCDMRKLEYLLKEGCKRVEYLLKEEGILTLLVVWPLRG